MGARREQLCSRPGGWLCEDCPPAIRAVRLRTETRSRSVESADVEAQRRKVESAEVEARIKMAKVRRKSSARDALEAWVRDASDFVRGRADGCVRIALQLFVRCVYALGPPPPRWVCLRRLRT